jgi:hypothetical protein
MWNEDYRDMLQNLSDHNVRFLVVGAYAMGLYGYPRATGDFDIWVEPSSENSKNVHAALESFGAPLHDIRPDTFTESGIVFQIGVTPRRIDILTAIDGVEFKEAYKKKMEMKIEDLKIPFISKGHLIKNKMATGREQDRLDASVLQKTHPR